jgi:hypothetical protein
MQVIVPNLTNIQKEIEISRIELLQYKSATQRKLNSKTQAWLIIFKQLHFQLANIQLPLRPMTIEKIE